MERRNQLQARFDDEMASAGQEIEELLESAGEKSYVANTDSHYVLNLLSYDSILTFTDTSRSVSLRADLISRLIRLFKKRGEIEAQIIAHSRSLELAYSAASNEFKEVLKGKVEDIDEGSKTVHTA